MVGKLYPANHKTVFVLDHTPYFGIPCEHYIDFDFPKNRTPGFIPLAPISKSLWTCSIEATVEYCRIVWDLFPQEKLVRVIASDSRAYILNSWSMDQQNVNHLLNAASIGVPPRPKPGSSMEYSVVHGLRSAIECMCEYTPKQQEKQSQLTDGSKILNRCRVICITSTRDDASIKSLEELFMNDLIQLNKAASQSDLLTPVHHCHLVIINTYPNNLESIAVTPRPTRDISPLLSSEVHVIKAGLGISSKLSQLILNHYDLASTTVTGIPMKEEQNANSSANYDVEIFHASQAHTAFLRGDLADTMLIRTPKEGAEYDTITLKWCTPRNLSSAEMHNCTTMHRITPTDVNSRPSSCLINFLLNGRSVMLEMLRRTGGKAISHLLTAHGGEIFIHTISMGRSILEDPPSISEGQGGRITDYRITDFGALMQANKLFPLSKYLEKTGDPTPLERMKAQLDRHTKYWPLTISSTCIFSYKQFMEPLLSLMLKTDLTDDEVFQCKQCIFVLIGLEAKHEPLQIPNIGQRGKGPKKEEQYRVMWNELESYLRAHSHTDQHRQVLQCLLECKNKSGAIDDEKLKKMETVELDQALRELDQLVKQPEATRTSDSMRVTVIRATTDSPMSPPPSASIPSSFFSKSRSNSGSYSVPHSILDLWDTKSAFEIRTRPQFAGRTVAEPAPGGNFVSKLYPNLKLESGKENSAAPQPEA
ncbi:integrator complex subunit 13 [Bemisia tabaci]|uniref:integrator complex subunit 13 n=1 Tax=Bemisia tabaci TaxID=7038 RepID=UPI0008F9D7D7|nr:PREDICTED: protein asunder homolog [Bemisia tabaci]